MQCRPIDTKEELDSQLATMGRPLQLIFFSSWCASCRPKMTASYADTAVLIGVFDEQENIDRAYRHAATARKCFFDRAGAAVTAFGVKYLPHETRLAAASEAISR